jgi:hypothetical protein
MALTPDDPAKAQVWIRGEAPNQIVDLYVPRGARGEVGPQGPKGDPVPTTMSVLETTTGPETPGATGPQGVKGDKGDPGGFTTPTFIGATTDLNLLLTPGLYEAPGNNVDTVRNYPVTFNAPFALTVTRSSSTTGQQIAEFHFTSRAGRVQYRRTWSSSGTVWTSWQTFASSRIDQTAGRVIYEWDDLNAREQLTWGDTGWRNIKADLINGWTTSNGGCYLRRTGNRVMLKYNDLNGTAATSGTFYIVPAGLRTMHGSLNIPARKTGIEMLYATVNTTGDLSFPTPYNNISHSAAAFSMIEWVTDETWPTSLPGIAGTIPNA